MAEKVNIEDGNEGISRWVPESERVSILRFSATQKNFHNFFFFSIVQPFNQKQWKIMNNCRKVCDYGGHLLMLSEASLC